MSVTFGKRGCEALLRKHPGLKARVAAAVESQIAHGLFKSKFATAERWEGQPSGSAASTRPPPARCARPSASATGQLR